MNGDTVEILLLTGEIISNNLFAYCNNNIVNHFDIYGYKSCIVHFARVVAGIFGLVGLFKTVGRAMPAVKRVIFASLSWTIKVTGAAGQLAACLTALVTLVFIILYIRSLYDLLRVFLGTCKYIVQEIRFALNPWHKHKKTDLSGPDLKNPFKGW